MTVCTASICVWNYTKIGEAEDFGRAIITASDRLLTDGGLGIEYEASRWKTAIIQNQTMILVAGDLTFHSEVLDLVGRKFADGPPVNALQVANELGLTFENVRRSRAAKRYLAPLGMSERAFFPEHTGNPDLLIDLSNKMQEFRIDVEAIVVGCEENLTGLFRIDEWGTVTNHADIGFVSIGIGGIHSSAQFMLEPYTHSNAYYPALVSTFLAKKRAEVAPGVGTATDMFVVTRAGVTKIPDEVVSALERSYQSQRRANAKATAKMVQSVLLADSKWSSAFAPTAPQPNRDRS